MSTLHLHVDARQSQVLSPKLQQAVQLLQMSSLDFAALVRSKVDENPFLEDEELAAEEEPRVGAEPFSTPITDSDAFTHHDRDMWQVDRGGTRRHADTGESSALDWRSTDITLAMHLHSQLKLMLLSPRDLCIAQAIVDSLDEDGYLRTPLEALADFLPLTPPVRPHELSTALRWVQALEPIGVGARSVAECLLLQCPRIEDAGLRQLARTLLDRHIEALAAHDVNHLARALGEPASRLEAAIACIRRLHPRPGWDVGADQTRYIVPDVVVHRGEGRQWRVDLNPAVVPSVRLNRVYEELFQHHRRKEHAELGNYLQDARWTLRNVAQRFSTIVDVAQAIVNRQHLFFEFGAMAMKPLLLREIADEVGIHESTVSRVTNNKYLSCPLGVFELKYFFSRSVVSTSGQACSPTAIRELIGDLIAAEPPAHPLSDGEITRRLATQGLVVSRRTVTKYRQLLRIPSMDKRRRLT